MFVVLLKYESPLEEIDRHMKAHVRFLKTCYERGVLVASGRRNPRTGGVLLARSLSKEDLEGVLGLDPFVARGLASYEIVEFRTSQFAEGFERFADPGGRRM